MKKIYFYNIESKAMYFLLIFIVGFYYNSSGQVFNSTKILDGYYYGSDRLFTNVFVKVSCDTAFVDFVFIQNYPRELLSDTLFYNNNNHTFVGTATKILHKDDKNYICTNKESMVFGKKLEIKLNPDEAYYNNNINEFKNYAVWHQCYNEFIKKNNNNDEAEKYFRELEKKNNVKSIMDTCSYNDFLNIVKKIKKELNSFKCQKTY